MIFLPALIVMRFCLLWLEILIKIEKHFQAHHYAQSLVICSNQKRNVLGVFFFNLNLIDRFKILRFSDQMEI